MTSGRNQKSIILWLVVERITALIAKEIKQNANQLEHPISCTKGNLDGQRVSCSIDSVDLRCMANALIYGALLILFGPKIRGSSRRH